MKIQIAGPGCSRCRTTEKNTRDAVARLGLDARVEHLSDVSEYAPLGVTLTPAVIVDGKILLSGQVPTVDALEEKLKACAR